jgi:TNF receptor-associated protein 1
MLDIPFNLTFELCTLQCAALMIETNNFLFQAAKVKTTKRLESHPCVITVEEMAAARHFIKTQGANFTEEQRFNILQPQLEINPNHAIMKKLHGMKSSNPKLAALVAEQLFANAMVSAGLVEDPRTILRSMNDLLTHALEKH